MKRILDNLKCEAIGRCRERIELASQKARHTMADGKPAISRDDDQYRSQDQGMTSSFKRRYGL